MKKIFKIVYLKESLNAKGDRHMTGKEVEIEGHRIGVDKLSNLCVYGDSGNDSDKVAIFSRNIWEKSIKKK